MGRKSKRAENLKRRSDFGSVNSEKENDVDNYSDVSETPTDAVVRKPFAGGLVLQLDSWPDELSPAQLAAYKRADDEHQEIQGKLDAIVKSSGGEVVFSGDSCAAYQVSGNTPATLTSHIKSMAPPAPGNTSSFSSETPTRHGTSRRERQSKQVANSKLSAIVQDEELPLVKESSKKTSSSKAPSRTTGRSSRSSQNTLSAPSPPPLPIKSYSGKSSKSSLRSSKNSVHAASPEPTSSKKQAAAAAGGVRPTEATSVGGLATTMPGQPKPKGSSTVVDLTKDDSGRPVPDSREVSFNKLQGKTFPSLVVVARPYLRAKDNAATDRAILDAKVKSVLMHTATKFTEWLIQQGLVRSEQICAIHTNNRLKLGMYSDVSKFPFSGGYVWISECCPTRFVSVFSGSLFEGATHPPSVLLKLIYHWSCQTNVQNVVQWVKVDNLYVKGLFTWLRAVCTVALHQHMSLLGGSGRRIEVGVISLGTTSQDGNQRQVKVEVLGVLDPEAKLVRLRAVEPLVDGERNYKKRFSKILEPLSQWVHKDSIILTDLTVDKGTLLSMGFKTVHQVSTTEHNNKNSNTGIMEYLRRIVPRMFQNTLSLLSRQIIQQFLDELVWREWYGNTPGTAFDNIVAHIAEQTRFDSKETLVTRLVKVAANPFKNWAPPKPPPVKESSPPQKRNRKRAAAPEPPTPIPPFKKEKREKKAAPAPSPSTTKRTKKQIQVQDDPDIEIVEDKDMTPIETFYYGIIEGDLKLTQAQSVDIAVNCCVCSETFTSNTKLLDHLLSHVNPVTDKESVQCRYCAELIPTEDEHRRHIIQAHPNDTKNTMVNTMACVMCETRYSNLSSLSSHMQKNHVNGELPYICGTCGYRCSSQRIAIEHYYDTHEGAATLQCPHCLQMTAVWSQDKPLDQNIQMFYDHLKIHMNKLLAKKCNKCALWFIHKGALKDHQLYCHLSQANQKKKIKNMCISSTMINRPKVKSTVSKETNTHTLTENFGGVTMYIPDGMNCVECTNDFGDPRHFPGVLKCVKCSFSTNCSRAMYKHGTTCSGVNSAAPSVNPLSQEMHCICGFSTDEGNKLAKHMAICDRKSAYASAKSAASNTVARSMLDMLGLVRRADPDGESSVDDNVEKGESDATQDTETPVEIDTPMDTFDAVAETPAEKMDTDDAPEDIQDNIPEVDSYSSTGDVIEGGETSTSGPVIESGLSLDDLAPPSVLAPQDLDLPQDLGKDEYQSLATPQVPTLESTLEGGFEPLPAEPMPQPEFEPL